MGPSVIAASTTQFNVLINSMFASTLGDGAIFWLAIAFRLMQLPLGLFGVALGTVTLPLLSRLVVAGHMDAFRAELSRAMRLMFLLTIPSTIGLMMLAEPIISVLYQHGQFDAHEAAEAAGALRFYAIGLAGYAALKVLVNAFYALDRRKTPMMVSFLAVGLNLLVQLDIHLPPGLGSSRPRVLHRLRGDVQFSAAVRIDAPAPRGGLESRRMLASLGKIAVAGAALCAVCAASSHWLLADWATQAFGSKAAAAVRHRDRRSAGLRRLRALLKIEELTDVAAGLRRRLARAR